MSEEKERTASVEYRVESRMAEPGGEWSPTAGVFRDRAPAIAAFGRAISDWKNRGWEYRVVRIDRPGVGGYGMDVLPIAGPVTVSDKDADLGRAAVEEQADLGRVADLPPDAIEPFDASLARIPVEADRSTSDWEVQSSPDGRSWTMVDLALARDAAIREFDRLKGETPGGWFRVIGPTIALQGGRMIRNVAALHTPTEDEPAPDPALVELEQRVKAQVADQDDQDQLPRIERWNPDGRSWDFVQTAQDVDAALDQFKTLRDLNPDRGYRVTLYREGKPRQVLIGHAFPGHPDAIQGDDPGEGSEDGIGPDGIARQMDPVAIDTLQIKITPQVPGRRWVVHVDATVDETLQAVSVIAKVLDRLSPETREAALWLIASARGYSLRKVSGQQG